MEKDKLIEINAVPILNDNYVWVISKPNDGGAFVIDPGEAGPVRSFLFENELTLKGILITHHHWDHTNGIAELTQDFKIPVIGPAKTLKSITVPLDHQTIYQLPNFPLTCRILHIPGHTLDHLAYYIGDNLFCGDTLFAAGCGRTFEGTYQDLHQSLQRIMALPDTTKIYCAHEYTLKNLSFAELVEPSNLAIKNRINEVSKLRKNNLPSLPSTLKDEKLTNPFLRCDSLEIIKNVEIYAHKKLNHAVDVFTWLRKWKDAF